ncbi:hypothetical protein [Gramella sp. AN32]|uniref:Methyltransferase n=1 Tax=Christiangramia antarctica TaxID=2058158 RepID=A0ABW5X296_9FLAO|nr:hypothetical protein [Gramella sp. AN32]
MYRTSSYVTEGAQTLLKENGYFIAVVNEVSPRMDPFIKVSKGSEFKIFGVKKY